MHNTLRWSLPTTPPAHDPALFARAMRDMRLTWRARGVLAELATGYLPGQESTITELVSLTRKERVAAEGRDAFRKAVDELRSHGYLSTSTHSSSAVGERLVAHLLTDATSPLTERS